MAARSRWVVFSILFALAAATGVALAAKDAPAKKGKSAGDKGDKVGSAPPGVTLNACGCYAKGNGCVCTNKKAKCECPGECEPVGCDEKRNKEMEKEYSDAVKHAQDEDKKREEAEVKKTQEKEKKRQADEAAAAKKREEEETTADEAAAAAQAEEEKAAAEKAKKEAGKKKQP
jgi:hypothetical protein